MDFSAFGAASRVWTDYGYPATAYTIGAEFIRYYRWPVTPSIEFRYKSTSNGRTVDENTFGGGIRVEHAIRNFRPYGTFLVSKGTIHYNFDHPYNPHPTAEPYTQDGSVVYSPGLGVDYDIAYRWAVLADYQYEFWNLGYNQTLTPRALAIGVLYRVSFGRE
jgi:hypothetical protein